VVLRVIADIAQVGWMASETSGGADDDFLPLPLDWAGATNATPQRGPGADFFSHFDKPPAVCVALLHLLRWIRMRTVTRNLESSHTRPLLDRNLHPML
jgi:hypothetical protein